MIAELQNHTSYDLQVALTLTADMASKLHDSCRGVDNTPVRAVSQKKSLSVSSWLTDATLAELALKHHTGRGGDAAKVGDGWIFEIHAEKCVTNKTRVRWLLLALILDLEERVVEEFLECSQLPTKFSVSFQGPGHRKEPGPGSTDGQSRSRSGDFPIGAFSDLVVGDVRTASVSTLTAPSVAETSLGGKDGAPCAAHMHPVYGTAFLSPSRSSGMQGLADGAEILQDTRYYKRITALVNSFANIISRWAREEARPVPVAQLTLAARCMVKRGIEHPHQDSPGSPGKRSTLVQSTLHEAFKRPEKRLKLLPDSAAVLIDIIDSD
jgi:hypothetical protein